MTEELQGIVQNIEDKRVQTQWGEKVTKLFTIDGQQLSGGFKNWNNVNMGDEVFVTYVTTPAGYKNIKGLSVVAVGTGGPAAPAPKSNTGSSGSFKGRSFPVEPLAPERTINRQNALTNAVNYAEYQKPTATKEEIVECARYFEAYTTGDIDAEEAAALAKVKEN